MIRTLKYIDIADLPEDAQEIYMEFGTEFGLSNGEYWEWEIGEKGSVGESYMGIEKCRTIDCALMNYGLKNGESIHLVFDW
jgi:hypothetical protein